ncbi:MAG: hypothetical protein IAE84_11960 [Saprospiraceae bacterium]|jgi:predicted secreted protein|nr:hypothetical protein [Saprospiraceae bacterium]HRF39690.1 hypothetical protein [Saprospiraceae bacterium]HRK83069.1 hypothetical protein [Saprospiraceae bacterium]
MTDINAVKSRIIQRIQETDEYWVIRSIQKLLDVDDEDSEWHLQASQSLNRAYGEEEPDYESIVVREPNPEYR